MFLNDTRKVLQSAMDCKEYSENNCKGCPHMIGDYYDGNNKDTCFNMIMEDTSTDDKAEILVQMYLLGANDLTADKEKIVTPYESRINEGEFVWSCSKCDSQVQVGQKFCHVCGQMLC